MPPGTDWASHITKEIQRSDGLLLIMSPDSRASPNVEVEWQQMLSQGKPVVPVLYRRVAGGFHLDIDKLNFIDVSIESDHFTYKFRRILDGLKAQGFAVTENLTEGLYVSKTVQVGSPPAVSAAPAVWVLAAPRGSARMPLIIGGVIIAAAIIAQLLLRSSGGTTTATATATQTNPAAMSTTEVVRLPTATPTPTPTHTPGVEVAFLPVRILSLSGIEIGNGTVRIFAPTTILSTDSTLIELELNLDQRYITPTPFGPITPIPVTRVTSTPRPSRLTPTPRVPLFEESGITAFQRMGATLYCPPERFTGCDQTADVTEARLIDWNTGGRWRWIIAPVDGVRGLQNLRLELWTVKRVNDGPELADPIWDHSFQIEIVAQSEPFDLVAMIQQNLGALIGVFGTIVAALIAAGYFRSRQSNHRSSKKSVKAKTVAKTKVFISYRRVGGASTAQTIKERLERKRAEVFLDVHDINAGRFDEIISKAIADCDYFVLVLAPGTLDSEWVVKEVRHAIKTERTIIPVLVDGYRFETHPTPADLKAIETHNAINLTPEYFDEGIERLAKFVRLT